MRCYSNGAGPLKHLRFNYHKECDDGVRKDRRCRRESHLQLQKGFHRMKLTAVESRLFLITAEMMCVDSETQKVTSILKLENAVQVQMTRYIPFKPVI